MVGGAAAGAIQVAFQVTKAKQVQQAIDDLQKGLKNTNKVAKGFFKGLASLQKFVRPLQVLSAGGGLVATGAAMGAIVKHLAEGVPLAVEFEQTFARMANVVELFEENPLFAGTANLQQVQAQIADIAQSSSFLRQNLMEGTQLLLTLGMRAETTTTAMQAAADYATAFGQSFRNASRWLTTIMDRPSAGMEKLRKAGIGMVESERQRLELLQEMGRLDLARLQVLKQFERFSGAAEARMQSVGGRVEALFKAMRENQIEFGRGFLEGIEPHLEGLEGMFEGTNEGAREFGRIITSAAAGMAPVVAGIMRWSNTLGYVYSGYERVLHVINKVQSTSGSIFDPSSWVEGIRNFGIGIEEALGMWDPLAPDNVIPEQTVEETEQRSHKLLQAIEALEAGIDAEGLQVLESTEKISKGLIATGESAQKYLKNQRQLLAVQEKLDILYAEDLTPAHEKLIADLQKEAEELTVFRDKILAYGDAAEAAEFDLSETRKQQIKEVEEAEKKAHQKWLDEMNKSFERSIPAAEKFAESVQNARDQFAQFTSQQGIEAGTDEWANLQKQREDYFRKENDLLTENEKAHSKYTDRLEVLQKALDTGFVEQNVFDELAADAKKAFEDATGVTEMREQMKQQREALKKERESLLQTLLERNAPEGYDFYKQAEELMEAVTRGVGDQRLQERDAERILFGLSKEIMALQQELTQVTTTRMSDPAAMYRAIQDSLDQQQDPLEKAMREESRKQLKELKDVARHTKAMLNRTFPAVVAAGGP